MNKLLMALNEFHKLKVSANKGGNNPHFNSDYSTLEDVISAVNQASQFGLVFVQRIDYDSEQNVYVETIIRHIDCNDVINCKVPVKCKNIYSPHELVSLIKYEKRYGLQSLFGLPSEDDDGNKATEEKKTNKKPKVVKSNTNINGDLEKLKDKIQSKSVGAEELGQSL